MKPTDSFTRDEANQLLFLETCAVDHGGYGDSRRMNSDDLNISFSWDAEGYIKFGMLKKQFQKEKGKLDFWVGLSEQALKDAGELRRMRAQRNRPDVTSDMFEE